MLAKIKRIVKKNRTVVTVYSTLRYIIPDVLKGKYYIVNQKRFSLDSVLRGIPHD